MPFIRSIILLVVFAMIGSSFASSTSDSPDRKVLHSAYLLSHSTDTGEAIEAIDALLQRYPKSDELWTLKAELHMQHVEEVNFFRRLGQLEQGLLAFEATVAINPQAVLPQALLYSVYHILPDSFGGGEAKAEAKKAELSEQSDSLLLFAQGIHALMEQDNEAALAKFRATLNTKNVPVNVYIAVIRYLIDQEEFTEAKIAYEQARAKYEDDLPLRYQYARSLVLQEQTTQEVFDILHYLIDHYDESPAKLLPEFSYLMLARAHQLRGNHERAKTFYRKVQRTAPKLVEKSGFEDYINQLSDS